MAVFNIIGSVGKLMCFVLCIYFEKRSIGFTNLPRGSKAQNWTHLFKICLSDAVGSGRQF